VVVKVEWHAGELFPRVGFIVTNLKWRAKKVVRFYNRRGTAEQWIKEGKNAVKWTKLSCRRFKDNAARLQLFALAYNLANFLRQLVHPQAIQGWTLTTLREKMVKIWAKVVAHAKYITFQLAEMAVPRPLFSAILEQIGRLRLAEALGRGSLRWTKRSGPCRRPSAVRRAGRFRRMSKGGASCALGSSRDEAGCSGAFWGKTLAIAPSEGQLPPLAL
jgi:hypothetical protein